MCCVSDDDLVIDRHRDENQTCKCRRAATHHHKKVIPLLWHKNIAILYASEYKIISDMAERDMSKIGVYLCYAG